MPVGFVYSIFAFHMVLGCGIGWVCGFTGSGGGILMLTVFTVVLGYNLKVAVGTSTMIMTAIALIGAGSHVYMGVVVDPLPSLLTVLSCLFGAFTASRFANRCEITKLNRVVGIVLAILGIVTILIKLIGSIYKKGSCFFGKAAALSSFGKESF